MAEMKQEFKLALQKMNFFERVKEMTMNSNKKYSESDTEIYNKDDVCKIFKDMGYEVRYDKKEKFYEIVSKINQYKFYCNIAVDNNYLDVGWYVYYQNELYDGDVWQMLSLKTAEDYEEFMKPDILNLKQLSSLLQMAMLLFEDFKNELVRSVAKN